MADISREIAEALWDKTLAFKYVADDPKESQVADAATSLFSWLWKDQAEQIIRAKLEEREKKVRELVHIAENAANVLCDAHHHSIESSLRAALEALND